MVFVFFIFFFWFCLTLSFQEKLENSIFEILIIPQTLNTNNLRTTSANSINLDIIRKFKEYSLKKFLVKAKFTPTVFKILLFKGRSVLAPTQRGKERERVK